MVKKPEIDKNGEAAVVITVRFSKDIIKMLDLITTNRSKFMREATYEKLSREMENK